MRHSYRSFAVAVALAVTASASVAIAQDAGSNPAARRTTTNGDVFTFGGTIRNQDTIITGSAFSNPNVPHGLARSARSGTTHITPVPEPSQWAMMLAGLALVGFIVRRNSKNNKKDD
jgi:hypothetical protein